MPTFLIYTEGDDHALATIDAHSHWEALREYKAAELGDVGDLVHEVIGGRPVIDRADGSKILAARVRS